MRAAIRRSPAAVGAWPYPIGLRQVATTHKQGSRGAWYMTHNCALSPTGGWLYAGPPAAVGPWARTIGLLQVATSHRKGGRRSWYISRCSDTQNEITELVKLKPQVLKQTCPTSQRQTRLVIRSDLQSTPTVQDSSTLQANRFQADPDGRPTQAPRFKRSNQYVKHRALEQQPGVRSHAIARDVMKDKC